MPVEYCIEISFLFFNFISSQLSTVLGIEFIGNSAEVEELARGMRVMILSFAHLRFIYDTQTYIVFPPFNEIYNTSNILSNDTAVEWQRLIAKSQ